MADPSLGNKRFFPSFSLASTTTDNSNKAIFEHEESSYLEHYFGSKTEPESSLFFYPQEQFQREKKQKQNQAQTAQLEEEEAGEEEREEERRGGEKGSLEIDEFGEPLVMGLRLGEQTYFEKPSALVGDGGCRAASARRSRSGCRGLRCLVERCNADLSSAKEYHKKHKVCQIHSKSPKVVVSGLEQRFCQQCSRFHILAEFDEGKRSCRKRLADHNARRRKPQLQPHLLGFSFLQGNEKADRFLSPMHPLFQYSSKYSSLPALWKEAEEIWVEGQNQQSNVISQWANESGENVSNGSTEHSYYGGFQGSRELTAGRSLFAIDPPGMARIPDSSCALSLLSPSSHVPRFPLPTEDSLDLSTHSKLSHLDNFMCEGASSCPPLPFFVQEKPHFGWASEALLTPPAPYPERITFSATGLESLAKDNRISNATTIGMGFDGGWLRP